MERGQAAWPLPTPVGLIFGWTIFIQPGKEKDPKMAERSLTSKFTILCSTQKLLKISKLWIYYRISYILLYSILESHKEYSRPVEAGELYSKIKSAWLGVKTPGYQSWAYSSPAKCLQTQPHRIGQGEDATYILRVWCSPAINKKAIWHGAQHMSAHKNLLESELLLLPLPVLL